MSSCVGTHTGSLLLDHGGGVRPQIGGQGVGVGVRLGVAVGGGLGVGGGVGVGLGHLLHWQLALPPLH